MANVNFIRGTYAKIQEQAKVDGQILVAKDKELLFIDIGENRFQVNDIIGVTALPEANAADVNKFYYVESSNTLSKSDGTSWKQVNAQQVIAEGTANGTISVGGVDIKVHGLGSAAYTDSSAYDTAGAANAVLGTDADESTANTVHGVKKLAQAAQNTADEANTLANEAKTNADAKVASVKASDASIVVGGTTTAPTVSVQISKEGQNALTLADDGLKVAIGASPEYVISKEDSATEGFLATYVLKKDGVQAGAKIDIPKDYLVKSAEVKECEEADNPVIGMAIGDKYIDFVVNTVGNDGNVSHIYLPVKDIVTPYLAGNGIDISKTNAISAKVVTGNGLSVDADGIKMAIATGEVSGAMSNADKTKLDSITSGAEPNYVKSVASPVTVSGSGELSVPVASGSSNGLMSSTDFTKLSGIADGAQVNVIESISFNGTDVNISGKKAAISLAWTDLE